MAFARLARRPLYSAVVWTGLAVVFFFSLYGIIPMMKGDGVVVLLSSIGMEPVPTVVPFEVSL